MIYTYRTGKFSKNMSGEKQERNEILDGESVAGLMRKYKSEWEDIYEQVKAIVDKSKIPIHSAYAAYLDVKTLVEYVRDSFASRLDFLASDSETVEAEESSEEEESAEITDSEDETYESSAQ